MTSRAFIVGVKGTTLSTAERSFIRDAAPWGLIVFARNIHDPAQVESLTKEFRAIVGRDDAPVLVDQEGGRVQRLGPPHWPRYPKGAAYLRAANDLATARELVRLGARSMAHDLRAVGITVDCVPVLDVPVPGAHDVIGDRAYALEPDAVAVLGRAACEGLLAGGVLPVVKHIPGHGRAGVDSHHALPVVDTAAEALAQQDFAPFAVNADMPLAMTAHVVYTAIDAKAPATTSRKVFRRVIRGAIGFDGLVMSDDLSMKALGGTLRERTTASLAAGCDVVLHCNGEMAEMDQVASVVPELRGKAARRAAAALARIAHRPEPFDAEAARRRLAPLVG